MNETIVTSVVILNAVVALMCSLYTFKKWRYLGLLVAFHLFNGATWTLLNTYGVLDWRDTFTVRYVSFLIGNLSLFGFLILVTRKSMGDHK